MILDLETIKKALDSLIKAIQLIEERQEDDDELLLALRDSVVQRFEYTYELSWKMIQRWLAENVNPESSEPVYSRKELYRLAARWGLIRDPLAWFDYHKARNVSAHTYNEKNAEQAFSAAQKMVDDVKFLILALEKRND
jgi:nucleotidyltransferase substrate binding protein (TIGR01987 family)